MPTINEVLERTNRVRPDAVDDETKAAWLIELDNQLYQEIILCHQVHAGPSKRGPVDVCPVCGGWGLDGGGRPKEPENGENAEGTVYNAILDYSECPVCGWSELPSPPMRYPEDGDSPALLVPAPYDGLYDLYLWSKVDFVNRERDNYNNSLGAYYAALDEWRQKYNREHLPLSSGYYKNLM